MQAVLIWKTLNLADARVNHYDTVSMIQTNSAALTSWIGPYISRHFLSPDQYWSYAAEVAAISGWHACPLKVAIVFIWLTKRSSMS